MDRLERFYRMERMLKQKHHVGKQEFLDALEVSNATFKRDLEYLRDRFQLPVIFDRNIEAYRLDTSIADSSLWQLPGLWFSADELRALLTMDRLLGDLQPGVLSELIAPLRKRLRELLDAGGQDAEAIARRIRVLPMGARNVEPGRFRAVATGMLSRRRLRIRHERRGTGEVLEREVSPQRLVHYRDNWYLDAWCHMRRGLRTFALDAIDRVTVTGKPAKEIGDDSLDRHFASGYGIFAGSDTQEAQLLFTPARARWVAGEVWHPLQDGKLQLDGSYLLRFPYSREPELVMDVLKYGPDVEVLAPASLREAVASRLEDAAARYRKG